MSNGIETLELKDVGGAMAAERNRVRANRQNDALSEPVNRTLGGELEIVSAQDWHNASDQIARSEPFDVIVSAARLGDRTLEMLPEAPKRGSLITPLALTGKDEAFRGLAPHVVPVGSLEKRSNCRTRQT